MSLTISSIEAAAPDQASLKAATKLLSPAKWPERAASADGALIWGACQGSGANPYRVAVDLSDLGSKCSCPSRKFPCKHALALMMQFADGKGGFGPADVPEWITDWLGRRRKSASDGRTAEGKSLAAAKVAEEAKELDPKEIARREAAKEKRAESTRASVTDGLAEMEGWIADQLRTGLSETLSDLTVRCRRIASRLVDAKAANLAARIDMIPARVLDLPQRQRGDALVAELGKLVILSRAWAGGDCAPEIRREIVTAETREALLENPEAPRYAGAWEVLASREEARRDGLIARSTWLLGLDPKGPRFALLQDFFPASVGKQGSAFSPGEQFRAELAFYPAALPLRAQIVERQPLDAPLPWPEAGPEEVLGLYAKAVLRQPWLADLPLLLPAGRLATAGEALWWTDGPQALPVRPEGAEGTVRGAELKGAVVLWNARQADLLAADTNLGRYHAA